MHILVYTLILVTSQVFQSAPSRAQPPSCTQPLLYFDLGNTLLKTDFDSKSHQIKTVSYFPNVKSYLSQLKKNHFRMGLIVNLPEAWGKTREAKITALKSFIKDHWVDARPMDWSDFELGILVPENDLQRKPAPHLFLEALATAKREGCPALYQGESQREIIAAQSAGMLAYEVSKSKKVSQSFLNVEQLRQFRAH